MISLLSARLSVLSSPSKTEEDFILRDRKYANEPSYFIEERRQRTKDEDN
jgi:hypothetical protein